MNINSGYFSNFHSNNITTIIGYDLRLFIRKIMRNIYMKYALCKYVQYQMGNV